MAKSVSRFSHFTEGLITLRRASPLVTAWKMFTDLSNIRLRLKYAGQPLKKGIVSPDPIEQFQKWFEQAAAAQLFQANAMTLATTTAGGRPAARMVLLVEYDERGFVFYTSYESRKGKELDRNSQAALVFWWGPLFRQVRIEGTVTRLSQPECDAYFASRPRDHQLEVWAFHQSRVIRDRDELKRGVKAMRDRYSEIELIPRPPDFGGYRLIPSVMEFWHGRRDWLHDSLRYQRQSDGSWIIERLAP